MKNMSSSPEIQEYNIYAFMWDKFGINPIEVAKCSADWVRTMIAIGNGESEATNQRLDAK